MIDKDKTKISWTDYTFNPWEGCSRVSPGCENCYAEERDVRFHGGGHWGKNGTRRMMSDANWRKPEKWNRDAELAGRPSLVFCASLADVFEDRHDVEAARDRLFRLIERTPHLIWLMLTKRPEHVLDLVPSAWLTRWPGNVWIGTTVEDQKRADVRVPILATIPAPVRFLSCEPLLGRVVLPPEYLPSIGWVIVGGESGPRHRIMEREWATALRDQTIAAGIPFFFKQWGGPRPGGDATLDPYTGVYHAWPAEAGIR